MSEITAINGTATINATQRRAEARRAAQEFEALLLNQLTSALAPAEESEDDLFGGSASGVYRQMFGEEIARAMSRGGGIGIADMILRGLNLAEERSPLVRAVEGARLVRVEKTEAVPSVGVEPRHISSSMAASEQRVLSSPEEVIHLTRPRRVFAEPHSASGHGAPTVGEEVPLRMPLWARLSSSFGLRRDPINGRQRYHAGVDLAAPRGTSIAAAGDGRVIFAGKRRGYGNTVVIEHADGRRTLYAHAERLLVQPGDHVRAGQPIATVGATGRATGPHLHFEVVEDGRRVDPLREVERIKANDLARNSR